MPEPYSKPVRITVMVDADHAHDLVTRRSVTGLILYVNNTPVKWISKRQATIETSTYGSELAAMRIAVEQVIAYRYMLNMLGIPVEKKSFVLCDNNSVVQNTTLIGSTLKKKHCAVS